MSALADGPEVVESTAVDVTPSNVVALPAPATLPALAEATDATAADLVGRLELIKTAMRTAMEENVDYGRIPGAPKPTLFKPGAEKLAVLFRLDVQTVTEKIWGPGEHLTVSGMTTVFHAPSGVRLGNGEGMCSTRERNYAKRQANRRCPHCEMDTIIKGKEEYGGGWLCFVKKGGCGAKWPDGSAVIEAQPIGEIDNPDLPDFWNTVVKMAKKRAVIDAILLTTGASAIFTQDIGEGGTADDPPAPPQRTAPQQQAAPATSRPASNQPTADPPRPAGRPAGLAQRQEIEALAKQITPGQFANVLLVAGGAPEKRWDDLDAAQRWADRALDHLPASLVDAVKDGIADILDARARRASRPSSSTRRRRGHGRRTR